MQHYRFSIVIPAYNYAHTLTRAVESVMRQSGDDFELLVVNDGSTDDTERVLAELSHRYSSGFRSITTPNSGLAATRNIGVDCTTGDYLLFLDADDALCDEGLSLLRDSIHAHQDACLIVGGYISVEASGREKVYLPAKFPADPCQRLADYLLTKKIRLANGAVAMHRRIFMSYRYPVEFKKAEDLSMFAYVLANYPVSCVKGVVARIYKHEDSLRHNIEYDRMIGMRLVDEIFDPQRLPGKFQDLKQKYMVQRLLSLSRTCSLAGDDKSCRMFFVQALRLDWTVVLRGSYVRHFIKALLR